MTLNELEDLFIHNKVDILQHKQSAKTRRPILPALVLADGHVMLAHTSASSRLYSYTTLEKAFTFTVEPDGRVPPVLVNNDST